MLVCLRSQFWASAMPAAGGVHVLENRLVKLDEFILGDFVVAVGVQRLHHRYYPRFTALAARGYGNGVVAFGADP